MKIAPDAGRIWGGGSGAGVGGRNGNTVPFVVVRAAFKRTIYNWQRTKRTGRAVERKTRAWGLEDLVILNHPII